MYCLVVDIYEGDGESHPVVQHRFYGETEEEARHYYESHKQADAFLRQCLAGKFKKPDGGEVACRVVERPIEETAKVFEERHTMRLAVLMASEVGGVLHAEKPPMDVQTLIFPKDKFKSADAAKAWARERGYKYGDVDETEESFRLRQEEPGGYDIMRTIELGDSGVKAVVGRKAAMERTGHFGAITFDGAIPQPGEVRVGVWDRFTTWGPSKQGGRPTEFNEETTAQFVRNFVNRGVLVPMDFNHQNYKTQANGMPARTLARYSALAVVRGGKVADFGVIVGHDVQPPDPAGMGDGVWGYRSEVTPLGQQILPDFRYISPSFEPQGRDEQNNPIGYVLTAVAATDIPFQGDRGDGAPEITYERGAARAEENKMPRKFDDALMKRMGFAADSDDAAIKQAYAKRMEEARKLFDADEGADPKAYARKLEEEAKNLEEEARAYEEAKFEPESGKEPPNVVMRRMAKSLRRMAKMDAAVPPPHEEPDEDDLPPKEMQQFATTLGIDPRGKTRALLMDAIAAAAVPAGKVAEMASLAAKTALAEDKAARLADEKKGRAAVLMANLADTFPGDRDALKRLAERDPEEAEKIARGHIRQSAVPAYLFDRATQAGGPLGSPLIRDSSALAGPDARTVTFSAVTNAVPATISGERLSEVVTAMADSVEPATKAKIDRAVTQQFGAVLGTKWESFFRYRAAEKIIEREQPHLVAAARI